MSKRPNPTLIGLFVVGTLVLAAIGLFVFSPKLFSNNAVTFTSSFQESVNGLAVGSKVKCQGVPVGEVTAIQLFIDVEEETFQVPVFYAIDMVQLSAIMGTTTPFVREDLQTHIAKGLRAQLQMESIVTGQMYIELIYHDDPAPPEFMMAPDDHLEIPTIFSPMAQLGTESAGLVSNLRAVNVNAISDNLTSFLIKANSKIDELDLQGLNESLMATANSIDALVNSEEVRKVVSEAPQISDQLNSTLIDLQQLAQNLDQSVDTLSKEVSLSSGELRLTLEAVRGSVKDANALMTTDVGIGYHLQETLISLTEAADALQLLAESIERNPDMLIRGKQDTEQ